MSQKIYHNSGDRKNPTSFFMDMSWERGKNLQHIDLIPIAKTQREKPRPTRKNGILTGNERKNYKKDEYCMVRKLWGKQNYIFGLKISLDIQKKSNFLNKFHSIIVEDEVSCRDLRRSLKLAANVHI